MGQPLILEHIKSQSVPNELDPREYGFYKAVFDIKPAESVGTALFAASESPRKRTLNAKLFSGISDTAPHEVASYSNSDLADILDWNPSAITRVSQELDGKTLIRVNDFEKKGKRIFPLSPILKNYASRVLNLHPIHINDTVLTMMDFIAADYHQDGQLYDHGATLLLIEQIYNHVRPKGRVYPEVRENTHRGYFEIIVASQEITDSQTWESIETQCEKFSNMLGALVLTGSDFSNEFISVNKIQVKSCDCDGQCVHYGVHLGGRR